MLNPSGPYLRLIALFGAGVLSVLTSAVVLPGGWLSTAEAAVPACVANGDAGQIAAIEDPSDSTSDDIRGTRSSVYVGDNPTSCQRISSIYVKSPSFNGSFEFGWVMGYSNCTGNTYVHPHSFYWAVQASTGAITCGVWTSHLPTEDAYSTFRASDIDANTYWGSYFNGTSLQPNGVNMDFARGHSVTGMERGATADSGFARWNNLEEYHDANGWTNWDNASQWVDRDPAYHFHRIDAHTAASQHD
jgi:hypothetical protein